MRIPMLAMAALLVSACATTPPPAAAPPSASGTHLASKDTAAAVGAAQKAGYKIVNKDGETLYCREDLKTGSHVRKSVTCLTEAELEMVRDAARRNVDQMQRATAIPQGK